MVKKRNPTWKRLSEARQRPVADVRDRVSEFLQRILDNPAEGFSRFSPEAKKDLSDQLLTDVAGSLANVNPVQDVRRQLAQAISAVTFLLVLIVSPEDPEFEGITGILRPRIREAITTYPEMSSTLIGEIPKTATDGQVIQSVYLSFLTAKLRLRVLDRTRGLLGDWFPDMKRDWIHPFQTSYCLLWEFQIRNALDLPPNLKADPQDENEPPGSMRARVHAGWPQLLFTGDPDPRATWAKIWEKAFNEPDPYKGMDFGTTTLPTRH